MRIVIKVSCGLLVVRKGGIGVVRVTVGIRGEIIVCAKLAAVDYLYFLPGQETLVHTFHIAQENVFELLIIGFEVSIEAHDLVNMRDNSVLAYDYLQQIVLCLNIEHYYDLTIVLLILGWVNLLSWFSDLF